MRRDGEGAINSKELFADDRDPASKQERIREDELHSLMRSILDWAISFLSEPSQGTIRAIYSEGKTVKQHSEVEFVTVYVIYKRLARSCPVIKEVVLEELEGSTTRRAPSSRPCSGSAVAMGSEQVEAAWDGAPTCSGNEQTAASGGGLNKGAPTEASSCRSQQDVSVETPAGPRDRCSTIEVRVSYVGECSVEEAVSRYLAARENVRDVIGDELD